MLAFADVHQRADHVAHHVVQEGVGAHHEVDGFPSFGDLELVNRSYRRLRLALRGTERRKIMLADEQRRRGAHALHVEWKMEPADVMRRESGTHRPVEKLVAV